MNNSKNVDDSVDQEEPARKAILSRETKNIIPINTTGWVSWGETIQAIPKVVVLHTTRNGVGKVGMLSRKEK